MRGKRVLIIPTYEQGTWADQVVAPVRNLVPMSDEADPLQLSMIGINPATAYLLLNRYVSLMPGDWIGQTAANAAMGQYIIALAKLAGVKTLNVVRRKEASEQVRQWGGDRVVLQGGNLHKDIEEALGGKKLSLVLDTVGGTPVGELAKSLKTGGSIVVYGLQSGLFPAMLAKDFIYRGLSLHGFWLINWTRNAPRTEIEEIYQKLGDLVADGSLSAVGHGGNQRREYLLKRVGAAKRWMIDVVTDGWQQVPKPPPRLLDPPGEPRQPRSKLRETL